MEKKLAHLNMIQGVVNRLSQNSFLLKGWSVVLVSALFALSASRTNVMFVYLAYFPAFAFWILDGYFLRQEKIFRALYDHTRSKSDEDIDFSMDPSVVESEVASWPRTTFSLTLALFHGALLFSIVVVMCALACSRG